MMSAKQVASRLGVSESLVYSWCASGGLPHFRMGTPGRRGRILIAEADLETFLNDRKEQGEAKPTAPLRLKHIKLS